MPARGEQLVVRLPVQRPVLRPALSFLLRGGRKEVTLQRSRQFRSHRGTSAADKAEERACSAGSLVVS